MQQINKLKMILGLLMGVTLVVCVWNAYSVDSSVPTETPGIYVNRLGFGIDRMIFYGGAFAGFVCLWFRTDLLRNLAIGSLILALLGAILWFISSHQVWTNTEGEKPPILALRHASISDYFLLTVIFATLLAVRANAFWQKR